MSEKGLEQPSLSLSRGRERGRDMEREVEGDRRLTWLEGIMVSNGGGQLIGREG